MDKPKKLLLNELKVGMKVRSDQIEGIYDVYIIIKNPQQGKDENGLCYIEGEIAYIGDIFTEECRDAWNRNIVGINLPSLFYKSSGVGR